MSRVRLPDELVQKLHEDVVGRGGFQSFVKQLKRKLHGNELEVDAELRDRIEHYAFDFGSGGWQTFFRRLLSEIENAAAA